MRQPSTIKNEEVYVQDGDRLRIEQTVTLTFSPAGEEDSLTRKEYLSLLHCYAPPDRAGFTADRGNTDPDTPDVMLGIADIAVRVHFVSDGSMRPDKVAVGRVTTETWHPRVEGATGATLGDVRRVTLLQGSPGATKEDWDAARARACKVPAGTYSARTTVVPTADGCRVEQVWRCLFQTYTAVDPHSGVVGSLKEDGVSHETDHQRALRRAVPMQQRLGHPPAPEQEMTYAQVDAATGTVVLDGRGDASAQAVRDLLAANRPLLTPDGVTVSAVDMARGASAGKAAVRRYLAEDGLRAQCEKMKVIVSQMTASVGGVVLRSDLEQLRDYLGERVGFWRRCAQMTETAPNKVEQAERLKYQRLLADELQDVLDRLPV